MSPSTIKTIRENPVYAYLGPLVLFQLLLALIPLVRKSIPGFPWYRTVPEQWIYPLQILVCGAAILFWWRHYDWRQTHWKTLGIGALMGVAGIAIWIAPTHYYYQSSGETADWMAWFGVRERDFGFNPNDVAWPVTAAVLRVIRMTLVSAMVEELAWRGFLMRYLVDPDRPFTRIAIGTHRWRVYGIVTALVVVVHQPADYFVAFLWASLVYWVAVKTRSLAACVMMHGVANLLLGIYILKTGHLGLW